jgi:hypothetical protein
MEAHNKLLHTVVHKVDVEVGHEPGGYKHTARACSEWTHSQLHHVRFDAALSRGAVQEHSKSDVLLGVH